MSDNAFQLRQAGAVLASAARRLQDEGAEPDELAALLEGAGDTADVMMLLDAVLRAAMDAEDMAEAAGKRAALITARRSAYERRAEVLRGAAFAAMDAMQLAKRTLPDLTASIAAGRPTMVITDEAAIPVRFMVSTPRLDRAALGEAVRAGEIIPGATLGNSAPSLRIRTK